MHLMHWGKIVHSKYLFWLGESHVTVNITEWFRDFYRELYNSLPSIFFQDPQERWDRIAQFLTDLGLPRLSVEDSLPLGEQITVEKLDQTLKDTKPNKASGPNGSP